MSASVEVTRDDAVLLRALASLVVHLPREKRAAHLAGSCEAFAQRIERVLPGEVTR